MNGAQSLILVMSGLPADERGTVPNAAMSGPPATYPDGVAATVTGRAASAGLTSSAGQIYTASRRE